MYGWVYCVVLYVCVSARVPENLLLDLHQKYLTSIQNKSNNQNVFGRMWCLSFSTESMGMGVGNKKKKSRKEEMSNQSRVGSEREQYLVD